MRDVGGAAGGHDRFRRLFVGGADEERMVDLCG